ncbi:amidohydrolase family protein [Thermogymnomonas acidicola]|uniref:amidohydrolase family protein n=1 Tax=Thermogymnomonas acidicola TaxID=399579 RepID=UPI0013967CCB|nr:amidohydrolase family protein [Thermogymnomonas acidicola]
MATLLPITGFSLDRIRFPPDARKFIDAGIPVAIGTDCSPVSYNISMPFAIYLAVRFCGMTVEEAINAATVNAAYSGRPGGEEGNHRAGQGR